MKYILSTSILALVSFSPLVKALPGTYSNSYNNDDSSVSQPPDIHFVEFECGYEVKDVSSIVCMSFRKKFVY